MVHDVFWTWALGHLVSLAGFGLAIVLLAGVLRDRRPPGSAMAWFLAITLIPHVAVPLYLLLGRRGTRDQRSDQCPVSGPTPAPPPGAAAAVTPGLERAIASLHVDPASDGNRILPLCDGDDAYHRLTSLLDGAETSIEISTFILGRDSVGEAIIKRLAERARAGVRVRLLLDAIGSLRTRGSFVEPLRRAGGNVGVFSPVLHLRRRWSAQQRNHRKLTVIDGRVAIIGGMNMAREYMGPDPAGRYWTDFAALVEGPIVDPIRRLFAHDWRFATGERIECGETPPAVTGAEDSPGGRAQLIASGPDTRDPVMRDALLAALVETRRRVCIVTPYFIPDEGIAGILSLLARQGKEVRLLIPERSNHRLADWARRPYLDDLRRAGAQVLMFRGNMLHAKLVLVDDRFVSVGSANMDMRSLYLNYEASVFVYSRIFAQRVDQHLATALIPHCRLFGGAPPSGSWRGMRDDMARLLSPLL